MKNEIEINKNKSPTIPKRYFKFKKFIITFTNHIRTPCIKKIPKLLSANKVKILDDGFLILRKYEKKKSVRNTFWNIIKSIKLINSIEFIWNIKLLHKITNL